MHTASANAEKQKWRILNRGPHQVEKEISYGHAVYCWKAFEEMNNFDKRKMGQE